MMMTISCTRAHEHENEKVEHSHHIREKSIYTHLCTSSYMLCIYNIQNRKAYQKWG